MKLDLVNLVIISGIWLCGLLMVVELTYSFWEKVTAYRLRDVPFVHEAGHALAAWYSGRVRSVRVCASSAGGFTDYCWRVQEDRPQLLDSERHLMKCIISLAGLTADVMINGYRRQVTRVVMCSDDDLRNVRINLRVLADLRREGRIRVPTVDTGGISPPLLRDIRLHCACDDQTESVIDWIIVETCELLKEHRQELDLLAAVLRQKNSLSHDEIAAILDPMPE